MKHLIFRIADTLAHDFKVMCAIQKITQSDALRTMIENYIKLNLEKPHVKEKFNVKI